ncbi:P-loop containing nucleoside triphosphate hydrolase protein [Obelidium mucronatum]|nr:P-loop containing nucleoside triphosphate hydrolase protein [Obelidium mucronatum]
MDKEALVQGIGSTAPSWEAAAAWWQFPVQSWLTPFLVLASKRPVDFSDLFRLLPKYETASYAERLRLDVVDFIQSMEGNIDSPENVKKLKLKLFYACVWMYPKEMIAGLLFHFSSAVTNTAAPIIMSAFLNYLSEMDGGSKNYGYFLCCMFLLNQLGNAFGWNSSQYFMRGIGMAVRGTMSSIIYQKSLTMSTASRLKFSNGRVFNLIASDCANLENFFRDIHALVCLPAQAIGLAILCIIYLGLSGAIGMLFLVVGISLNSLVMSRVMKLERGALKATDDRVKTTSEVLNAMKIVKLFAWERSFTARIKDEREVELGFQRRIRLISVIFAMFINVLPTMTNLIIFGLLFAFGTTLTPATVFTALTIVNLIRLPVQYIPFCFQLAWTGMVSFERIAEFLLVPDRKNLPVFHQPDEGNKDAIVMKSSNFSWPNASDLEESLPIDKNEDTLLELRAVPSPGSRQLKDIDLNISSGSLVVVVGKVGSGKSSLFHAILGDMERTSGSVDIYGRISYASQTPWLQSASIKQNILFGAPFDEKRYKEVLHVCSLERDLTLFADGDLSEIGEKGVTLSGGQAARVGLARAVYANRDILLLDDPLAAVDSHVGKHLLEKCILQYCRGKTVVLVTHQLHVAHNADHIVMLQDGMIVEQGPFDELINRGASFAAMMQDQNDAPQNDAPQNDTQPDVKKTQSPKATPVSIQKKVSKEDVCDQATPDDSKQPVAPKALMTVEERAVGRVESKYYLVYLQKAGGYFLCTMILLCAFLWQTDRVTTDMWLTFWLSDTVPGFSGPGYIWAYFGLALGQAALLIIMSYAIAVATIRAGRHLHNECLDSVMQAPMYFFETNPIGRIVSRFSKDFAETDRQLPILIQAVVEMMLSLVGIIVLISYAVPLCLIFVVLMIPLYIHFLKFFRSSIRELKRLENLGRSPLYAHISETLSGLSTIRSYQSVDGFISIQNILLDAGNQPIYIKSVAECWMSNRAEGFVALLIFGVALIGLISNANTPLLGLALSYALTLMTLINMVLPRLADLEARMNSIERICHYINELPREKRQQEGQENVVQVSKTWPSTGNMEFQNLGLRYRADLDPVLHNLSFSIKSGEKVGVVGRTGAGKSTIITAAFRIVESSAGTIVLDGVDISMVPLETLRGRLSIIPQAPILFEGTIRFNLDPMNEYTDETLWNVLERCALKEYVVGQDQKLESSVTEGGDNLSVGQRQLLCLGRAMLRQSKVLFIDEATASVDMETDTFIQKVIREDFADATVICVAHRLNTLIDYDKILVLDQGRLVEFDSPNALLNRPDSAFSSLVDETGEANAKLLRSLAETAARAA